MPTFILTHCDIGSTPGRGEPESLPADRLSAGQIINLLNLFVKSIRIKIRTTAWRAGRLAIAHRMR